MNEEGKVPVKAYWKAEFAALYNISGNQLRVWIRLYYSELKKIGYKRTQKRLTIAHVELLFDKLGRP